MSFEYVFFLFESREKKKEAGSNTEHNKRERTEQIRVERKEIETQCGQAALH